MVRVEIAVAIIPYSPDLAPSDFFLFPEIKEDLLVNASQMTKT